MKFFNMRIQFYAGLVATLFCSCEGDPMNTAPDATGNIVSVAINTDGVWKPTPLAVDASTSEAEYNVILITLSSPGGTATEDVHVTMEPAPDSLASYNEVNETEYVMMGTTGTPAFTLFDGGVVTIPKGSNYGYLKIKTISADYFGTTSYALAYRISGVQESGYTVSSNNGYSISPFLAKNKWDGVYDLSISTTGWAAYGIADDTVHRDYGNVALSTTGLVTCTFLNLVRGDQLQPAFTSAEAKTGFGAATPNFVFNSDNKLVDVFNSVPDDGRGRSFSLNPAATDKENVYDPVNKVVIANYLFHQKGRPDMVVHMKLKYVKSR